MIVEVNIRIRIQHRLGDDSGFDLEVGGREACVGTPKLVWKNKFYTNEAKPLNDRMNLRK